MVDATSRPLLEVRRIDKSFGPIRANRDVSLSVRRGEIVGLVGENGAGKSTLLSILGGFLRPDAGEIAIDGELTPLVTPHAALLAGIGLVHQHFSLVPSFTVREQLELAGWERRTLPPALAGDFTGSERIEDLQPGRRQRVEIAKALVSAHRLLLLDEPTSILAPSEVESLFGRLEEIRRTGTAIVIVTHKVREMLAIADRIVVMTNGAIAGTFARADGTWPEGTGRDILERMFARDLGAAMATTAPRRAMAMDASPLIDVRNLSLPAEDGGRSLHDITFALRPGELSTIVGIDGQGQSELAETICGYRLGQGQVTFEDVDVRNTPAIDRARQGMALLADDRIGEAGVGEFPVRENLILKRPRPATLSRLGVFRRDAVDTCAQRLIDSWSIRPDDPGVRFGSLSGGNMQRVLAARELDRSPRLLVALNPVTGLDAQSAALVWARFRTLCDSGAAVLAFTTDLDEAIEQGDRMAVMFEGRLSQFEESHQAARARYGSMMVNGWR